MSRLRPLDYCIGIHKSLDVLVNFCVPKLPPPRLILHVRYGHRYECSTRHRHGMAIDLHEWNECMLRMAVAPCGNGISCVSAPRCLSLIHPVSGSPAILSPRLPKSQNSVQSSPVQPTSEIPTFFVLPTPYLPTPHCAYGGLRNNLHTISQEVRA